MPNTIMPIQTTGYPEGFFYIRRFSKCDTANPPQVQPPTTKTTGQIWPRAKQ